MKRIIACGRERLSRRGFIVAAGATTAAGVGGLGLLQTKPVCAGDVVHRPISEFVEAQGTTFVFVPPAGDYVAWTAPAAGRGASVDYAAVAARYLLENDIDLGTSTAGTITERPLPGDRAEVLVILHTTNALTWAIPFDPASTENQFGENPLLFGFRAHDIVAGQEPALGESHLQLVYRKTFGAPVPDLTRHLFLEGDPDLELISVSFRANATGPLHELAGLGPDGTPGRCITTQTGVLFRGPFKGATGDGFPAERVELRVIGR